MLLQAITIPDQDYYCEGGFEERQIGVVHALFEKSGARRGPVLGRLS
jgi:hypothetical protein